MSTSRVTPCIFVCLRKKATFSGRPNQHFNHTMCSVTMHNTSWTFKKFWEWTTLRMIALWMKPSGENFPNCSWRSKKHLKIMRRFAKLFEASRPCRRTGSQKCSALQHSYQHTDPFGRVRLGSPYNRPRKIFSFFNLDARWGWVVNDTSQLLYSR